MPSSVMILCISSIHSSYVVESKTCFETKSGAKKTEAVKVELTDGWCEFQLSHCLARYIYTVSYTHLTLPTNREV